jgi:hypothetical protein
LESNDQLRLRGAGPGDRASALLAFRDAAGAREPAIPLRLIDYLHVLDRIARAGRADESAPSINARRPSSSA